MTHNALYEKLVDEAESKIQGYVAYGLYKSAKRQWITDFKTKNNGKSPTKAEVQRYVATYTPQIMSALNEQSAQILVAFAVDTIAAEEPRILKDALRGRFWPTVLTSVFATFLYTVALLMLTFILAFLGVDILSALARLAS